MRCRFALPLILASLLFATPARAHSVEAALLSFYYAIPLSLVVPSVYGVDVPVLSIASSPRFVFGWAWQIPLTRMDNILGARNRMPLEVTLAFGHTAVEPPTAPAGMAVDARLGYRRVLGHAPEEKGVGWLLGAGGSMEASPRLNGALYPEIGLRYRPSEMYPIVLNLIARCDFRFKGDDLIRPSVVLSISIY